MVLSNASALLITLREDEFAGQVGQFLQGLGPAETNGAAGHAVQNGSSGNSPLQGVR